MAIFDLTNGDLLQSKTTHTYQVCSEELVPAPLQKDFTYQAQVLQNKHPGSQRPYRKNGLSVALLGNFPYFTEAKYGQTGLLGVLGNSVHDQALQQNHRFPGLLSQLFGVARKPKPQVPLFFRTCLRSSPKCQIFPPKGIPNKEIMTRHSEQTASAGLFGNPARDRLSVHQVRPPKTIYRIGTSAFQMCHSLSTKSVSERCPLK